jgi:hypothetical protein
VAYTRYTDLPWAHLTGALNPAGTGSRLRTDREWTFREQLCRWGIGTDDGADVRCWKVVTHSYGEGKQSCTLPSGRRIKFYDDYLESEFANTHHAPMGPFYWLTFEDAEALWFDNRALITPHCEAFTIAPNAGKEEAHASV